MSGHRRWPNRPSGAFVCVCVSLLLVLIAGAQAVKQRDEARAALASALEENFNLRADQFEGASIPCERISLTYVSGAL